MLADDQMEELTINSIIELWFRYEPKNDSVSEIRKNEDKKIIITALFQNGALSGELKTRIDINERSQDVYPNYITGKFRTHNEDEAYRGIPYTKTVTTEVVFCKLIDIKNFLELKKERPPSDSPLFKKLQILGDFSDQSDSPHPRSKSLLEKKEAKVIENGEGNQDDKKEKHTRKDNLSHAINSAIVVLGKKPSLDELWRYIQDDKDESGIIVDFDDAKIVWIDTKGIIHDTPKNTLANRLSRIKM